MIRYSLLLCARLLFPLLLDGQCTIPGGDFEESYDYWEWFIEVSSYEEDSFTQELPFIEVPLSFEPSFTSAFSHTLWGYSLWAWLNEQDSLILLNQSNPSAALSFEIDSLENLINQSVEIYAAYPRYQVHQQLEDGTFAAGMKTWFNSTFDAYIVPFECVDRPKFLRGHIKHEGIPTDSLIISVVFGERAQTTTNQIFGAWQCAVDTTLCQELVYNQALVGADTLTQLETEFTVFEIPLSYEYAAAEWDSVSVNFWIHRDSMYVAQNPIEISTFLFDDFSFSNRSLAEEQIAINQGFIDGMRFITGPNPVEDFLFIESAINNNAFQIFDYVGKKRLVGAIENNQINVSSLPPGVYIIRTKLNSHYISNKFVKI